MDSCGICAQGLFWGAPEPPLAGCHPCFARVDKKPQYFSHGLVDLFEVGFQQAALHIVIELRQPDAEFATPFVV